MKTTLKLPSSETLSRLVTYDPMTGRLFWKERRREDCRSNGHWLRFNKTRAGREAGHKHLQQNGKPHAIVLRFWCDGKDSWFLAHRVIYALMGVDIPEGMEIDHKNCNPFDNRWDNLRLATPSQNMANTRPAKRTKMENFGLPKGVTMWKKKFKVQISRDGKKRHVGLYSTAAEASAAYLEEATKASGEFARSN